MIPNLTTTIKRNDGKRIQIRVRPRIKLYGEMVTYEYDVIISPPGKRKFVDVVDVDSYEYRSLFYPAERVFSLFKSNWSTSLPMKSIRQSWPLGRL